MLTPERRGYSEGGWREDSVGSRSKVIATKAVFLLQGVLGEVKLSVNGISSRLSKSASEVWRHYDNSVKEQPTSNVSGTLLVQTRLWKHRGGGGGERWGKGYREQKQKEMASFAIETFTVTFSEARKMYE